MSGHDDTRPFEGDLRSQLDRSIEREGARPDLADMFARAGYPIEIEVDDATVVAFMPATANDGEPEVEPFNEALRDRVESALQRRALASIPAHPARSQARRGRGSAHALASRFTVAAAVLGLMWLGSRSLRSGAQSLAVDASDEAQYQAQPGGNARGAVRGASQGQDSAGPPTPSAALETDAAPSSDEASVDRDGEADPGPAKSQDPTGTPATTTQAPPARPKEAGLSGKAKQAELAALETEAKAAWRAGDLDRSAALFEQVIKRAGRSPSAEFAYADLFLVLSADGDHRGLAKARRGYLRRFSRGRFAQDVRAAACAADPSAEQRDCWADYLEHHPRGSHREQAFRALGSDSPDQP